MACSTRPGEVAPFLPREVLRTVSDAEVNAVICDLKEQVTEPDVDGRPSLEREKLAMSHSGLLSVAAA